MTNGTVKSSAAAPTAAPMVKKFPVAKAAKTIKTAKALITKKAVLSAKAAAKPANKLASQRTLMAKKKVPTKPAKAVATPKPAKNKKLKMVRDNVTMPKTEYAVLDALKMRAAKLGSPVKKTQLLRAGIKALAAMSDKSFTVALKVVPSLKISRPGKS